ncbi:MAG: NUDIX domain-containing protein [Patescibacteria group bacterium]|nr:NUDIX domain-containing protein [Patescibacteria group bacterium]
MERELLEETGYKVTVQLVTTCFDDAYSTMRRYCFVATDCEKVSESKAEEHEFIELKLLSLENFRKLLRSSKNRCYRITKISANKNNQKLSFTHSPNRNSRRMTRTSLSHQNKVYFD